MHRMATVRAVAGLPDRGGVEIGIGAGLATRPLPHTWTPPFCKAFVNDRQMGLRLRPYIRTVEEATATPLSLMEFADRALITTSRSKRLWEGRVFRSPVQPILPSRHGRAS
jgi:hypothetical protein